MELPDLSPPPRVRFKNFYLTEKPIMWMENIETIQTWVNGGEVILKKVGREFCYRLVNEPGDWIPGLPDGMIWADAQALFYDSL